MEINEIKIRPITLCNAQARQGLAGTNNNKSRTGESGQRKPQAAGNTSGKTAQIVKSHVPIAKNKNGYLSTILMDPSDLVNKVTTLTVLSFSTCIVFK